MSKKTKIILFDLDNTLIDRDIAYKQYLKSLFTFCKATHVWSENEKAILAKDNHGMLPRDVFEKWLVQHFPCIDHLGSFKAKHLVGHFVQKVSLSLVCLLSQLEQFYTLGIFSNGGARNQRLKLERSGLSYLFPKNNIFISEEIGSSKPNHDAFLFVQQALGCRGEDIIFVGDDYINDVSGGLNAGWRTFWINPEDTSNNIESFVRIEDCIALLLDEAKGEKTN